MILIYSSASYCNPGQRNCI